ncbi:short chain dehydrogenase [Leisingera aquaemixtae]|uniref:Short chain dehydrogenase n=2 Tax=Leisingera aquaemixtae TaxID=1396826 RepID=A0A0N7M4D7_9RHOB|nr:short chain dehydrogenase [Leisingera aquaemixtae]
MQTLSGITVPADNAGILLHVSAAEPLEDRFAVGAREMQGNFSPPQNCAARPTITSAPPAAGQIACNTAKAAVTAFLQNLARNYVPDKIRVNAVCLGAARTPMLEDNLARTGQTRAELNALVRCEPTGRDELLCR